MMRVVSKLSTYGALGLAGLSFGACSQGQKSNAGPEISAIGSALEDPVADCQSEQATCLGAAADRAAAVQCTAAFRECLGGAAEVGQQLVAALESCREKAAACAVQGGATGASACRDEYDTCVSAASSGGAQPPADDAGTPTEPPPPAAGSAAPQGPGIPGRPGAPGLPGRRLPFAGAGGIGGLPTLPGFPRLPGAGSVSLPTGPGRGFPSAGSISLPTGPGRGFPSAGSISLPTGPGRGLPGRPGSETSACYEALRTCVEAPNADLNQCATTARECIRAGGPLGAAGAGGAP
jgi:hypothetical protein